MNRRSSLSLLAALAAMPLFIAPSRGRAQRPSQPIHRPVPGRPGRPARPGRLYGGSGEHRLQQEMLLGIGGVRALRLWSRLTGAPAPDVYHANEGHAGFLGLERIRELVATESMTFDEALEAVRAATVFTTHTPVPAGIDRFGTDQIETYFGGDNAMPGLPVDPEASPNSGSVTTPGAHGNIG